MNPGEVICIEFPGDVQAKRRPAVALSSPLHHTTRPDIIVGLITSETSKSTSPIDYLIQEWQGAGLRVPSAFRAFILTFLQSAAISTMGTLSRADWDEVMMRVKLAIDMV